MQRGEKLGSRRKTYLQILELARKSMRKNRLNVDTTHVYLGFPGGSNGKESSYNMGDLGLTPGLGRFLGRGHGNPLQYSCLENPHGQRSLAGYSP